MGLRVDDHGFVTLLSYFVDGDFDTMETCFVRGGEHTVSFNNSGDSYPPVRVRISVRLADALSGRGRVLRKAA